MVMMVTETGAKLIPAHRTVAYKWSNGEEAPWHLAQSWCINIKYKTKKPLKLKNNEDHGAQTITLLLGTVLPLKCERKEL